MSIRWFIKCLVIWNMILTVWLAATAMDFFAEKWEVRKMLRLHTEIATESVKLISSYHEYMSKMIAKPIFPDTLKIYLPQPDTTETGS